jgi:hypothetical protein
MDRGGEEEEIDEGGLMASGFKITGSSKRGK